MFCSLIVLIAIASTPHFSATKSRDRWVESFEHVLKITGTDPTSDKLYKFIKTRSMLALAVTHERESSMKIIEEPKVKDDSWFILTIVPDHEREKDPWKSAFGPKLAALYSSESRAMILAEDNKNSPIFAGILLGHEAAHAYRDLVEKKHIDYEEVEIYSWGTEILKKIGGHSYRKVLDQAKRTLEKEVDVKDEMIALPFWQPSYDPRLEKIFGPAQSETENKLRMEYVTITAMYELIEEKKLGDEVKLLWTETLFQSTK